jgi:nitrate reductase assembly molybdenum cofactor insertion protein NarJ
MTPSPDDAPLDELEDWLKRAAELRAQAHATIDPVVKAKFLAAAEQYEGLFDRLKKSLALPHSPPFPDESSSS